MDRLSHIGDYFKPKQSKVPEYSISWVCRRISVPFLTVWDAFGRIRYQSDGCDKLNKFTIAFMQALGHFEHPVVHALKRVNDITGSMSFFGRVKDLTEVDKRGRLKIHDKSPLKATSITFLMLSKAAELSRWLKGVQLFPVTLLAATDASLGHVASSIGQTSVARVLLTDLGQAKNTFGTISWTISILDNVIQLIDTQGKWTVKSVAKIILSIIGDIGKIILSQWFRWYVMAPTFVAVALVTSAVGLAKILLVSYTEQQPLQLPNWVKG